ncbi:carbohydrate ABC transporter permease [Paenibacillus arenilitoris]|uniref:Carbohydrate ABC transporter permease n=1 Tax=Paenibacillus arenilitoris TaxID=2772299 RepID=A0A927CP15_9BACL|nr:carbohydrate ABC transporter permease [Paenibacillus arenilitoris]MBD2869110.1 carbohydrate ABC transporter permease [Paenibacillus arenilitoris]
MNIRIDLFQSVNTIFITLFALACTLPMLLVLVVSFTDEQTIMQNGYSFFPEQFSLEAYKSVFSSNGQLLQSYSISIFVTFVGTLAAVVMTGMAGYALANRQVRYRNRLALIFFITMLFNAGLVPWYMINDLLGIKDNIYALIIPSLLFSPFNLFLVKNFMQELPESLLESARIDGANDAYIAFRIVFPLSLPVLATIALFYGLGYWNNWFNAIMLIDSENLYPLQYLLYKLQSEINMINQMQGIAASNITAPTESFKMAIAIITIGPIVFLYPFLQRFIIKGLIVGAVKG